MLVYTRMQALYRQYRPKTFADVVGQDHIVTTLQNQVKRGSVAHAYVFVGTRGVGKTSVARLFAAAVNCLNLSEAGEVCGTCEHCQQIEQGRFPDIIEIDAASHTGVDNVRTAIVEAVRFAPMQGARKVFIIDEVHMLSTSAFNALLKTLEEPPAHALFILATTEYKKVPDTVASRCQRFFFRNISESLIANTLTDITKKEGREMSEEAIRAIARVANGSLRDAERTLEQVFGTTDNAIEIEHVQQVVPVPSIDIVFKLIEASFRSHVDTIETTLQAATNEGVSMRLLQEELIELARVLLLAKRGATQIADLWKLHANWSGLLAIAQAQGLTALLGNLSANSMRNIEIGVPYLGIELALLAQQESASASAPVSAPVSSPKVMPLQTPIVTPQPVPAPVQMPAVSSAAQPVVAPAVTVSTIVVQDTATPAVMPDLNALTIIEDLTNKWKRCCEIVAKQSISLPLVLNEVRPLSVDGRTVKIAFSRRFHFETMNDPKNLNLLIQAVREVLQVDIDLQPVFLPKEEDTQAQNLAGAFGGAVLDDGLAA